MLEEDPEHPGKQQIEDVFGAERRSTGATTKRIRAARMHSGLGVPITVDGKTWGTIIALAQEAAASQRESSPG